LRWERHFAIGLIFALPGALLALTSYGSSPLCGILFGRSSSCTYQTNYESLSVGLVLGFLALTEFIVAIKRRTGGDLFWESDYQRTMRKTGMIVIAIGALASLVTFFKVENTPTVAPWVAALGIYGISFYSGLTLVAIGAGIIMGSRFLKIKPMKAASDRVLIVRA
jgi:hypothetical protein